MFDIFSHALTGLFHVLQFLQAHIHRETILWGISMTMAVFMYLPLLRRFLERHHTRDFAKSYCWLNFLVQVNNGILACVERAPFLRGWYICQAFFCAVVLYFVYKYWDCPPPAPPVLPLKCVVCKKSIMECQCFDGYI